MINFMRQAAVNRTSSGAMVGIGVLASAILAQPVALESPHDRHSVNSITVRSVSGTKGSFVDDFTGEYPRVSRSFADELVAACQDFFAEQRPIEPEIAALLANDLWDIYAR